jgi:diguanylate cyclase (GGDEF)-like protein
LKTVVLCLIFALHFVPFSALAIDPKVDSFLKRVSVKTYDCPSDDMVPELEAFLLNDGISQKQHLRLQVQKAHWLICVGKFNEAKSLLMSTIENPQLPKDSQAFASAIYQIGFIFDVQEDAERCDYYQRAQNLAKDRFNDIYLSAQLGQITVCSNSDNEEGNDIGQKLGSLFSLLEEFLAKNDKPAIAHIHNNIGLLYGSIGQNSLAAEQYEKSYLIGLDVYEEKNQIAPLISLISAHMSSGNFEQAKLRTDQLKKANLQVNTPLSNTWVHFAEARYFYKTGDFESLKDSLAKWQVFQQQISNEQMLAIFGWYETALCLHEQNRDCVRDYLETVKSKPSAYQPSMNKGSDYLTFMVNSQLFLGDIPAAKDSFERLSLIIRERAMAQQKSAMVLGVAKLHSEILTLEASLADAERQRYQSMIVIVLGILAVVLIAYFLVGKRYLRKISSDPLTGLRNEHAALSEIKSVSVPTAGKTNALALFDLRNFTKVNSEFGHMTGELALKSVADCLKNVTRERDIVGRLGADQFVVCLKNTEDAIAKEFFQRIQDALEKIDVNTGTGQRINIDSSMSMYTTVESFKDLDEVLIDMRDSLIYTDK